MPSFVFVQQSAFGTSEVEGILCDPGVLGFADRRTDVRVKIRLISEQTLCVDGEARTVISRTAKNGMIEFLVGSGTAIRHRERRQRLAQATALTEQLRDILAPLTAESEEGIAAPLQEIFDWLREEREKSERATAAPRSIAAEGAHDVR